MFSVLCVLHIYVSRYPGLNVFKSQFPESYGKVSKDLCFKTQYCQGLMLQRALSTQCSICTGCPQGSIFLPEPKFAPKLHAPIVLCYRSPKDPRHLCIQYPVFQKLSTFPGHYIPIILYFQDFLETFQKPIFTDSNI